MAKKICIIGAGRAGMEVLSEYDRLQKAGYQLPEIVCFEKQGRWGGQWQFDWRTGTDEFGDPVQSSMYHGLFINGAKETQENPDHPFDDYFGKNVPSYIPREVFFKYFEEPWIKNDLKQYIRFYHEVKSATFDEKTNNFVIQVWDRREKGEVETLNFHFLVIASGIWNFPHKPSFPGIERFPGEVVHSRDIRSFTRFKDQDVLVVGASFSAEDVVMHLIKHKAKRILLSYRTLPMGYLPIEEKKRIRRILGSTVIFEDNSEVHVDSIIFATGYEYSFPYLQTNLKLTGIPQAYHTELYKGTLFLGGANDRLFYLGGINIILYTWTIRLQTKFFFKVVLDELRLPPLEDRRSDIMKWVQKLQSIVKTKSVTKKFDLYLSLVTWSAEMKSDLAELIGVKDFDVPQHFLQQFVDDRMDFFTFRDKSFVSLITGTRSVPPAKPFMDIFYDTFEEFKALYL